MSVVSVLTLRRSVMLTCLINTVSRPADSISLVWGNWGVLRWDYWFQNQLDLHEQQVPPPLAPRLLLRKYHPHDVPNLHDFLSSHNTKEDEENVWEVLSINKCFGPHWLLLHGLKTFSKTNLLSCSEEHFWNDISISKWLNRFNLCVIY